MNQEHDYFARTLKSARTFFARWQGAQAELWELRPYHRTLRIVVRRPESAGNLLIACLEPASIRAPIAWSDCRLAISTHRLPGSEEVGFRLVDGGADVEIITGGLEVKENVKLSP
jgi:hypothetical protein